jgi:hypothetical protein
LGSWAHQYGQVPDWGCISQLLPDVAELLRVFFPNRECDAVFAGILPNVSGIFPDHARAAIPSAACHGA